MTSRLTVWVVYDHPKDFPDTFVARRFDGEDATAELIVCTDLETIRQELQAKGLVRFARDEQDDPKILESWL